MIDGLVNLGMMGTMETSDAAFEKSLTHLTGAIEGNVEQVIRKTILDLWTEIVTGSPVRSGRYRASHGIMISEPSGDEPTAPKAAEGEEIPMPRMPLSGEGKGFKWSIEDSEIWFYNNLVYAEPLEEEHSKVQAPAGVYRVSLSVLNARLQTNMAESGLI